MKQLIALTSDKLFTKSEYDNMDNDQKRYAQEQLQMAKLSVSMSRRKRVENKIATLTDLSEEHHHKCMDQLNRKMASVEQKRRQQLRQRIETCKLHDESWRSRMKQIDRGTKTQYKEAEVKLQRYQEDYEKYLQSRKSHTQPSVNMRQSAESKHCYYMDSIRTQLVHNFTEGLQKPRLSIRMHNKTKCIPRSQQDGIIKDHQQKCKKLQNEKQNIIFQKAMGKLEHIRHIKHQIQKKNRQGLPNQLRNSPAKRYIQSNPELNDESSEHLNQKHNKRHEKVQNIREKYIKQKQMSHNTRDNRLLVRHKKQQQESQRRWQAFEHSQKKGKKQHILRVIRGKVAEYMMLAQRF